MTSVKTRPKTPTCVEEFDSDWVEFILKSWLDRSSDVRNNIVSIKEFTASINGLQGQLSTTYVVDVKYVVNNSDDVEEKSLFVKVRI